MISLAKEQVLTLNDAAKRLPRRRGGKRPHIATLYRWAQSGVRGVQLEVLRVGGTLCTSVEALQRFAERCSGIEPSARTSRQRQKQKAQAEAELTAAGI